MCLNWVDCHHQLVKWSSVFGWWWWMWWWWWWWWWEAPGPVSVLESQFLHESRITPKSVILPRLISGFLFPCPRNTGEELQSSWWGVVTSQHSQRKFKAQTPRKFCLYLNWRSWEILRLIFKMGKLSVYLFWLWKVCHALHHPEFQNMVFIC